MHIPMCNVSCTRCILGFVVKKKKSFGNKKRRRRRQRDEEGEKTMGNREGLIQHLGHCILKQLPSPLLSWRQEQVAEMYLPAIGIQSQHLQREREREKKNSHRCCLSFKECKCSFCSAPLQ